MAANVSQVLGATFEYDKDKDVYVDEVTRIFPCNVLEVLARKIGLTVADFCAIQVKEQSLFLDRFRKKYPKLTAQVESDNAGYSKN